MENQLEKRYGLTTAIAMVVGIVIGSGVFFKAEKVLNVTGGDLPLGILAWIIGGCVMVACAYAFSILATRYEKVNGILDYAEAAVGEKYGYLVGWFLATTYYPTLTSVLAWVSARYFSVLMGWDITGGQCMTIAGMFLIMSYALNVLSPKLSGKFQVSTTVIKLIPLGIMAIFGTIKGLSSDMLIQNFTQTVTDDISTASALFQAIVATAFAYEGWIIATSINAEIKDSKKNLPKALVIGTISVVTIYIAYYIGLAGTISNAELMESGETGVQMAFESLLSSGAGSLLMAFIVVSCLGTLNGLMMGCVRGFYAFGARGRGPKPEYIAQVDKASNMPTNAGIVGLLLAGFWLTFFYGANLTGPTWFGLFSFDSSELPIITIYAFYIPIFASMMFKEKDLGIIKGKIAPALAICGSIFMVIAACFAHGYTPYVAAKAEGSFSLPVLFYLIVFAVIMAIGVMFMKKKDIEVK